MMYAGGSWDYFHHRAQKALGTPLQQQPGGNEDEIERYSNPGPPTRLAERCGHHPPDRPAKQPDNQDYQ